MEEQAEYDSSPMPAYKFIHPISDLAINGEFPVFAERIRQRLLVGADAYGDISFSNDPVKLLAEIEEEVLDICGWSFILFHRIKKIREKLNEANISLDKTKNP